ncbi:hypothetical protein LguiA_033593 [Lonicera macranthoides]
MHLLMFFLYENESDQISKGTELSAAKSYARLFSLFNKSVKLVHTRGLLITVPEEQALVENVFSLLSAKANNGSAIL